jgi:hypothetical protein
MMPGSLGSAGGRPVFPGQAREQRVLQAGGSAMRGICRNLGLSGLKSLFCLAAPGILLSQQLPLSDRLLAVLEIE